MKDEAVLPGPVNVVQLVLDVLVDHHQLNHVPLHLQHNILEMRIIWLIVLDSCLLIVI